MGRSLECLSNGPRERIVFLNLVASNELFVLQIAGMPVVRLAIVLLVAAVAIDLAMLLVAWCFGEPLTAVLALGAIGLVGSGAMLTLSIGLSLVWGKRDRIAIWGGVVSATLAYYLLVLAAYAFPPSAAILAHSRYLLLAFTVCSSLVAWNLGQRRRS